MAAVESGGADVEAVFVGDFFRADEAGRVASAGGRNGGVEGVREGVAESDARRGGFDQFAGARAIKHAGLSSHNGSSLYTGARGKEVESQMSKVESGKR